MQTKIYFFFLFLLIMLFHWIICSCTTVPVVVMESQPAAELLQQQEEQQPEVIPVYLPVQQAAGLTGSMPIPLVAEPDFFQVDTGGVVGETAVRGDLSLPVLQSEEIHEPNLLLAESISARQPVNDKSTDLNLPAPVPGLEPLRSDVTDLQQEPGELKKTDPVKPGPAAGEPTPAPVKTLPQQTKPAAAKEQATTPAKIIPQKNTPAGTVQQNTTKPLFTEEQLPEISLQPDKEILIRTGDDFEISLMQQGWIFPGFLNEEDIYGLAFITREAGRDFTRFLFKAKKTGEYPLEFILQDNTAATASRQQYLVKVADEEQFYTLLNRQTTDTLPAGQNLKTADKLYEQGKYVQALSEYLKNYDKDAGYLNERIAGIYEQLGDFDAAARYWKRNLTAASPYAEWAAGGLVRGAVQQDDPDTILAYLDKLTTTGSQQQGRDLLDATAYLAKQNRLGLSIKLLDNFLTASPGRDFLAEIYYLLAGIYEKDSTYRDLKKSRGYYSQVTAEFPESEYSNPSRERVKYLDRYFFYIW